MRPRSLRDRVVSSPDLIGTTIAHPFLASDVIDLYLKGASGALDRREASGTLRIEEEGKASEAFVER